MELKPSKVTLSVADNHRIASEGMWTGTVNVARTATTQSLEVFESNGAFQVILGKLWLHSIQAIHRYDMDEITIQAQGHTMTIMNDEEPPTTQTGPPQAHAIDETLTIDPGEKANRASKRVTDPANPEWVQAILEKISIGTDLTDKEWMAVTDLIKEYPDIFVLSLSEVFPVDFMTHKLKIDPNIALPKKVHQWPVTEPQRKFFKDIINDMEKAGVIHAVPAEFIKCLNATNLAPKEAGKNLRMSHKALLRWCNEQCHKYGLTDYWEQTDDKDKDRTTEADLTTKHTDDEPMTPPKKWRVCQAFHAVNAATQIPAFPSGDLKTKQQAVAGKRWVSIIDLAAGYYAIKMDQDAIPYMAFYVEGRGYFVYLRMLFGLTGAPTTFCEMVAIALDDMINKELVNWMDDICMADNDFASKLTKMQKFFNRCREKGLSLMPAKCKLFQSKVVFGGVMVSADGITPNGDKVLAVIDWPEPTMSHELLRFLGLTGFFRRHIQNYVTIVQPLSDLTHDIQVEKPKPGWKARKGAYKQALQATSLIDKWGDEQKKAFLTLKVAVTSEPVLKSPQYDGQTFRVVTNSSKKDLEE